MTFIITLGFKKVSQNKEFDWPVAISRYGLCSVFSKTLNNIRIRAIALGARELSLFRFEDGVSFERSQESSYLLDLS